MIDFIMWWMDLHILEPDTGILVVYWLIPSVLITFYLKKSELKNKPVTSTLIGVIFFILYPIAHIVTLILIGYGFVELTNKIKEEWDIK